MEPLQSQRTMDMLSSSASLSQINIEQDTTRHSPRRRPQSCRRRKRSLFSAALAVLMVASVVPSSLLLPTTVEAYISCQAVPRERQMEWLKQMTNDFTHVPTGHLSQDQLSTAPELLYAWSHSPQKSVEKALALESLVKRWIDEKCAHPSQVQDLTVQDYNCLLEGWARSGAGHQAAERCEQILQAMEIQGGVVQPDLDSYKAVLMAWRLSFNTNSNNNSHDDDANKQRRRFKKKKHFHHNNNNDSSNLASHAAIRAQRILEGMIRSDDKNLLPDADCFDIVLQTWSRCAAHHPQAPQQAESVLAMMERLYEQTRKDNADNDNNTDNDGVLAHQIKPRTTSFNAVLATWSRSKAPNAAERALDLLNFMEVLEQEETAKKRALLSQQEEEDKDHQAKKEGKKNTAPANDKKEDLSTLISVAPDNASYCTVMGAVSRANVDPVVSAVQAEALLRRVEDRYYQNRDKSDDDDDNLLCNTIIPDTILFNTAMGCWAKTNVSGSYRKARSILDRQLRLCRDLKQDWGDSAVRAVMNDDKKTNDETKASASPKVDIYSMREYQADVFGYTSVIASCASESGSMEERNKAFNVAFSTFRQMEQHGIVPNHVTYGNMLKAVARLLPGGCASRKKWAKRFFQEACQAGCVGDMVLSRTREALPNEVFKNELLQGRSKRRLPALWTRNLPTQRLGDERKHRLTRNLSLKEHYQQQQQQQQQNTSNKGRSHKDNNSF